MQIIDLGRSVAEYQRMSDPNESTRPTALSRDMLEQMVSRSSEGILVADARADGLPVVYANPAYEILTGYSAEELTGNRWPLLLAGPGETEVAKLRHAIGRSERCEIIVPDLRKDGTTWFARVSVEPLYSAQGDVQYILCRQKPATSVRDSGATVEVGLLQRELGRARQQIANLDRQDHATGLLRFEYFRELLQRDLRIAHREQRPLAVLVFEVVDLDVYRQTFGSKAAESCLRMIAAQLSGTLRRAGDLSTRCGDDTLTAVVNGQDFGQASELAQRIAANVRGLGLHNPRARSGRYVTVNVGVSSCTPGPDDAADSLIERARADLHAADVPHSAQRAR